MIAQLLTLIDKQGIYKEGRIFFMVAIKDLVLRDGSAFLLLEILGQKYAEYAQEGLVFKDIAPNLPRTFKFGGVYENITLDLEPEMAYLSVMYIGALICDTEALEKFATEDTSFWKNYS